MAIYKSCASTEVLLCLAAKIAASLHKLAIYAPLNPGVKVASLLEYSSLVLLDSKLIFDKWTLKICFLPYKSGKLISIKRSNLPGLINALSRRFCLLVAAITMTLLSVPKPSISTRIWFKVLSLSSWDPCEPLRLRPTASISSIKIIDGDFYLANANKSLTLDAPTPTKISTKSDPEVGMKGTPA